MPAQSFERTVISCIHLPPAANEKLLGGRNMLQLVAPGIAIGGSHAQIGTLFTIYR
jgi:hypothetical protein